jgi:hypothetical protein
VINVPLQREARTTILVNFAKKQLRLDIIAQNTRGKMIPCLGVDRVKFRITCSSDKDIYIMYKTRAALREHNSFRLVNTELFLERVAN